jgi:hypothetical protein
MPIIATPPAPPIAARREGERANQRRALPAAIAQMLSQTRAIA